MQSHRFANFVAILHHTWRHDPQTTSTGSRRSEPPTRRRRIDNTDNWQLSWVELSCVALYTSTTQLNSIELCHYKRGFRLQWSRGFATWGRRPMTVTHKNYHFKEIYGIAGWCLSQWRLLVSDHARLSLSDAIDSPAPSWKVNHKALRLAIFEPNSDFGCK